MDLKTDENISIQEAMTFNVITAPSDTSITDIAKIMTKNNFSSVVIKDQKVEGIITSYNIISKVVSKNISPQDITAGMVMESIVDVPLDTTIREASSIMIKNNTKVLLVIDDDEFKGLLTLTDIVRVSPELLELFIEKNIIDETYTDSENHEIEYIDNLEEGVCENCGVFGELGCIGGVYLCSDCIDELNSEN